MTDGPNSPPDDETKIPALFATIHFRSPRRPTGYTDEDIADLNRLANVAYTRSDDDS